MADAVHKQRIGKRELWSRKLTAEGEAVVARYCAERGIKDPVAAGCVNGKMDSAELMQTSMRAAKH